MSSHTTLDAAATERKSRLAKLKSLKRKQPPSSSDQDLDQAQDPTPSTHPEPAPSEPTPTITETFLSGRNYDASTRGPKLGFEIAPSDNQETLELRAADIAASTKQTADAEEKADKPIDLFKLQPKKPNWDLKRDVARKMEPLLVQTDNAIARMVRERIAAQKKMQKEALTGSGEVEGDGEVVGLQGEELVEGIHQREREEAEDERRDGENDEEL